MEKTGRLMHLLLQVCLLIVILHKAEGVQSCRDVVPRLGHIRVHSAEVYLRTASGHMVKAYCECDLGGGIYTFYHPSAYRYLTQADINHAQTDKNSVLLRARYTDGTQPYGVARQLPQYTYSPVTVLMNSFMRFTTPLNRAIMGTPYIYVGFLQTTMAKHRIPQGLRINGSPITFTNCDGSPNNYISFFANYGGRNPVSYATTWNWTGMCNTILQKLWNPSSIRRMPVDYFTFTETHWGGCGCFGQTVRRGNTVNHKLLGMAVGLGGPLPPPPPPR